MADPKRPQALEYLPEGDGESPAESPVEAGPQRTLSDMYVEGPSEAAHPQHGGQSMCYSPKLKDTSAAHFRTDPTGKQVVKWKRISTAGFHVSSEAIGLWREGVSLYNDGHYARAAAYFTQCIDLRPLAEFHSSRSKCWLKLGNKIAALRDAMQAVERSRNDIQQYLSGGMTAEAKREMARFIEYYYTRGKCFAAQGGEMGGQLALQDFQIVSTQSTKISHWVGDDPPGWEDIKEERVAQYEEECQYVREYNEQALQEWLDEGYDEADFEPPEQEKEPLPDYMEKQKVGVILETINDLKSDVADVMAIADDYDFSVNYKSLPMNHRTKHILLPAKLDDAGISKIFKQLETGDTLHRSDLLRLLGEVREVLSDTQNIVHIPMSETAKVHIVGDIHGQLHDLLHIVDLLGFPSEDNVIIFNGDFVDRGAHGMECVTVLLLLKCAYPDHFHMARGNHEDHAVNEQYHFLAEVLLKYGCCNLYHAIQAVFNHLPIAHVVGDEVLVVHGGIPAPDTTLDDIQSVNRLDAVPDEGILCDILWSDPQAENGRKDSGRGRGKLFGPDCTKEFLETNGLRFLVRSHDVTECIDAGYDVCHDGRVYTVFSAPNYCGSYGNKASVMHLDHTFAPSFTSFDATDNAQPAPVHPYHFHFSR
eukprot:TRINITY_DN16781_c0_g1_i1.p1 TRINITY_DN16781_c0_g1~~TRINITY_DN16781_c0_g1_i1.p1  ORF type:complete len:648 (+),score=226.17 TRINITY_DN16781_c0_g1_i1:62-2005(+)